MNGFDESFWVLEDRNFGIRMKKMSKAKNKRLVHLKKPVIVSTRKNSFISLWKTFRSYLKIIEKNGVKKEENAHDMFYDIDNLR